MHVGIRGGKFIGLMEERDPIRPIDRDFTQPLLCAAGADGGIGGGGGAPLAGGGGGRGGPGRATKDAGTFVDLCVCVYVELAWVGLVVVTVPSPSIDQSIHPSTHLPTHGNRTRWRRW